MKAKPGVFDPVLAEVAEFIREEALPEAYGRSFLAWYAGAVKSLALRAKVAQRPLLVGLSGCQGSGKSTLARLMARVANRVFGARALVLSLDDFYLPKSARQALAANLHPLFATRGVPGTHDLALLKRTLNQLAAPDGPVELPVFDKARDDRTSLVRWGDGGAPAQLIILEGWCVGVPAQSDGALLQPINPVEADQDQELVWRREINRQLQGGYAQLFEQLEVLLFLKAPGFDAVFDWRWEQEQKLSATVQGSGATTADATMSRREVAEFILHYQRLTQHALDTVGQRASIVWEMNADRAIQRMNLTAVVA